jgi:hypothetical protein
VGALFLLLLLKKEAKKRRFNAAEAFLRLRSFSIAENRSLRAKMPQAFVIS